MARKKATYDELQTYLALARSAAENAAGDADTAPARKAGGPARKAAAPRKAGARIRVLVADDHEITRRMLFHLIQHARDLEIVGLAPDGPSALGLIAATRPDVAVVDFELGEMSGLELTRRIVAGFPSTQVICLSMYDEETVGPLLKRAGAVAYIEKGTSSDALLAAIRACYPPRAPLAKSPESRRSAKGEGRA